MDVCWTILTFANMNGKKRKKSRAIYSGELTGGPCVEKLMVNKEKSVANVVAYLAGAHRARARLPPRKMSRELYSGGFPQPSGLQHCSAFIFLMFVNLNELFIYFFMWNEILRLLFNALRQTFVLFTMWTSFL